MIYTFRYDYITNDNLHARKSVFLELHSTYSLYILNICIYIISFVKKELGQFKQTGLCRMNKVFVLFTGL